jgi:hypothetical protein
MTIQMFAQSTTPMQFSKRVVKLKRTKPSVGNPLERREVHNALDGANAREEPIQVPEARTLACTIGLPTPLTINPEPSMGSDDEEDALSFGKEVQERNDGDPEQPVAGRAAQETNDVHEPSEPDIEVFQDATSNGKEYELEQLPAVLGKQTQWRINCVAMCMRCEKNFTICNSSEDKTHRCRCAQGQRWQDPQFASPQQMSRLSPLGAPVRPVH